MTFNNEEKIQLLHPFWHNIIAYTKRVEFSKSYLKGKKVLDIGFVDHDIEHARRLNNFIHDNIRKLPAHVVGLDTEEGEVAKLQQEGYVATTGDIENKDDIERLVVAKGKFETIFAGELVEHLLNLRSFFEHCHRLLDEKGILIISTPNAVGFPFMMGVLKTGSTQGINPTHTLWFDPLTLLTSASGTGFRLVNFAWYVDYRYGEKNKSLLSRLYFGAYKLLLRVRPYFAEGFVMVLAKD
jgi:2-polyprenyl-3-methyl-5-hydroxy-6-metoxy-1,4-benzoquinol methylase